MNKSQIDLKSLENVGKVIAYSQPDGLFVSAPSQNVYFHVFEKPLKSYVKLPQRYRLPLQIDLTVNVAVPGFYLVLGNGHLSFGTRQDNRSIGDICNPDCKKPHSFSNGVKLNQDVQIRIIYGLKFMQIIVDGETRYFSKKEKYMRAQDFGDKNNAGFEIMLAPDKLAKILIKEILLVEYETDPAVIPYENTISPANLSNSKGVKVDFLECISGLSKEIQDELVKLNDYLLSQESLKIKRKIEGDHKGCKVTYVSSLGFSYSLLISEELLNHFFWWYMVSNYKYGNQYMGRKNDLTNETLQLAESLSPEIASRLVGYFNPCVGCVKGGCKGLTTYEFKNRKFNACHGKIFLNMDMQTFRDIRFMFDTLQKVLLQNGFIKQ